MDFGRYWIYFLILGSLNIFSSSTFASLESSFKIKNRISSSFSNDPYKNSEMTENTDINILSSNVASIKEKDIIHISKIKPEIKKTSKNKEPSFSSSSRYVNTLTTTSREPFLNITTKRIEPSSKHIAVSPSRKVTSSSFKSATHNLSSKLKSSSNSLECSTVVIISCPSSNIFPSSVSVAHNSSQTKMILSSFSSISKMTSSAHIHSTKMTSSAHIHSTTTHRHKTTFPLTSHHMHISSAHSIPHSSSVISKSRMSPSTVIPVFSSAIPIIPPMDRCKAVTLDFSSAMDNFTKCILVHLDPMTVCKDCINRYDELTKQHRLIRQCKKELITNFNAQYQIVPKMYESQMEIWRSLACEKCYKKGSLEMNEEYIEFEQIFQEVKQCFKNASKKNTDDRMFNVQTILDSNNTKASNVCTTCESIYNRLQKKYPYYVDSDEETTTKWCADINVAVNNTRHLWSYTYCCGRKEKNLEAIIALTCVFCFFPIAFYIGAKLHSDVKERNNANRFYESD